jgi:adenylate cyclase
MRGADHCVVCGLPLSGPAAVLLRWRGLGRSPRSPNSCTACSAHLEEGRLVQLTVLFADLSSFTTLTQRLGPVATHAVVDEYLRLATATLTNRGAFIDKYIGDAVMAFFNVPIKRADHAQAAVDAAAELQALLPELSARVGEPLRASIGIASGFARVGRLGSDDIKDYTAIGEPVNEAARLQAQARASEILVSRAVYEKVAAAYPDAAAETLSLKGFAQPTVAYRLNGPPAQAPAVSSRPEGRPAMNWGAVALALLGSGCLGNTLATALTLTFGAGSAASLWGLGRVLDDSPARLPLLAASAALAVWTLVSLHRQRKARRDCRADHSCLEMTRAEKRQAWLAAGLAATSLALVACELWIHYVIRHPLL